MSVSAYIGLQGGGKSYEAVSSVIIPAVKSGRRVVTNISGINPEKIYVYCLKEKGITREKLGEVIGVDDDEVLKSDFLPYKDKDGNAALSTFCRPGDLIVIDEAWRIWPTDSAVSVEHRSFIAEHRHFTHPETGQCCDMAYITQSLTTIARFLRDRTSKTFRMKKLTALGLAKRYWVDVFEGVKQTKTALIIQYQCGYKADIFPLYKSYDGQNGNEQIVDKRQSALQPKFIILMFVIPLILLAAGITLIIRFFSPDTQSIKEPVSEPPAAAAAARKSSEAVPANQGARASSPVPAVSSVWRIGGQFQRDGFAYVVLVNNAGRIRTEALSSFTFEGLLMSGYIDGEQVTVYSGSVKNGGVQ